MNMKIHEVSDFSDSQFSVKIQKLIRKLPKRFGNCELRTTNSNPVFGLVNVEPSRLAVVCLEDGQGKQDEVII